MEATSAIRSLPSTLGAASEQSSQAAEELRCSLEDERGHAEYVRGIQENARKSGEELGQHEIRMERVRSDVVLDRGADRGFARHISVSNRK